MGSAIIIVIFILGYIAIAFEYPLKVNKAASALITGVLCWTVNIFCSPAKDLVEQDMLMHLSEIASILFFLLGAMTIVELIDEHNGFDIISRLIRTKNKGRLLVVVSVVTFFVSAILDNLTTTIIMLSVINKILKDKEDRWYFAGMIIIAANAGGAWSPLGDVTTTMLWTGGQVSSTKIILKLILPGIVCCLVPLLYLWYRFRKKEIVEYPVSIERAVSRRIRMVVVVTGILSIMFVPVFKNLTHLPPFMGMLLALGIIWAVVSVLHGRNYESDGKNFFVLTALQKIDMPSILFFLGILLSVAALQSAGSLQDMAHWMAQNIKSQTITGLNFGLASAFMDNVPLVAAAQGMYSLNVYPTDHFIWELIAFTTGTGGSAIIIGSAAGVAAMGIEKINFVWYLKKISLLALVGMLAGTVVYVLMNGWG